MSSNVEILRSMLAKLQAGDFAGGEQYLREDLVIDEPESVPHSGVFHGQDASGRVKEIIRATWDQQMGELELYESGELVISRRPIVWTSKKTGKSADSTAVEFFEFRDGNVARITGYPRDTHRLMQTLEP